MRSRSRNPRILARSPALAAPPSARPQSTGCPSDTDSPSASVRSSGLMSQNLRELADGALHRHARGVPARALDDRRDFVVIEVQLDPKVHEQSFLAAQLLAGAFVAVEKVDADGIL